MPLWIKHQSTVTPQAATNSATGAPIRCSKSPRISKETENLSAQQAKAKCGAARKRGALLRAEIAENDAREARR